MRASFLKYESLNPRHIAGTIVLICYILLASPSLHAQGYTGTYYIASNGNAFMVASKTDSSYSYNVGSPSTNFYLVPAQAPAIADETDVYRDGTGRQKPLLTTYPTGKVNEALWVLTQVTDDDGTFYYIYHPATGKCVVYDPFPSPLESRRKCMHLETVVSPPENAKFLIEVWNGEIGIVPKSQMNATHKYWNLADRNRKSRHGLDSPNYYGGLLGLYQLSNNTLDANSKWKFESGLGQGPTINYNSVAGTYTITTDLAGGTIRYTTDGSDPATDPNSTAMDYDGTQIVVCANHTVRAVVVGYGMVLSEESSLDVTVVPLTAPTFSVDCDNQLAIACNDPSAAIHYNYTTDNSDPADPDNTATEYTGLLSGWSDGYKVKAIAYQGGCKTSPISSVYTFYTNTVAPTVSLSSTEATISFVSGVTIYYTTNGTDPVPGASGVTEYSGASPKVVTGFSETADVDLRVIAKTAERGSSCPATVVKRPQKPTLVTTDECDDGVRSHTLTFDNTEGGHTYWYALTNGSGSAAPALGSFIGYTPGDEVNIDDIATYDGESTWVTLHAYAKDAEDNPSAVVSTNFQIGYTAAPTISMSILTATLTGAEGATFQYKLNSGSYSAYSEPFEVTSSGLTTITATATVSGRTTSCETVLHVGAIAELSQLEDVADHLDYHYVLTADLDVSGLSGSLGASATPFTGTFDGNGHTLKNLSVPLISYANGAKIYNLMLDGVSISSGADHTGALVGTALGATRIYNVGVLGGSVSAVSGKHCGGIVGFLKGSSRVINCFSYATIAGGKNVGGIVGNVDNTAPTPNTDNPNRMVMNCMFYGDITGGTSKAPVYNGQNISNLGQNKGLNNYNYFLSTAGYVQNNQINNYNTALAAEPRFLQRFEFYRYLLNSNRAQAAWWATGDVANAGQMYKWVLLPDSLHSDHPYPILRPQATYPSVVNYDSQKTYDSENDVMVNRADVDPSVKRNQGGKLGELSVTISPGTGAPTGASLSTTSKTLVITDKDEAMWNYNYGKVQLPYYNEVGTGNYTHNKVVTGWKITSITAVEGDPYTSSHYTGANYDSPYYNFADRASSNKDKYSVSKRVFAQGAYWDVPEGVAAITIEPYWAKAVYLSDEYYDVTYKGDGTNRTDITLMGQRYANDETASINGSSQKVYTSMSAAVTALFDGETLTGKGVYDYAVVLVGNYHLFNITAGTFNAGSSPFTLTSADLDFDNEPDNSFIYQHTSRKPVAPIRFDFINIPGMGMAQKGSGATNMPNVGIFQPKGWFEITNTALIRLGQFEYDQKSRANAPLILQGGVIDQMVSQSGGDAGNHITYYHLGGNVWMNEFQLGCHQDKTFSTRHVPVSVTGGEFGEFHLTGTYRPDATIFDDNAECYINGGKFGIVSGAGNEGLGTSDGKGNVTWMIDHADIKEFYGGGLNYAKPIKGSINTTISNSRVSLFCGGPKFGNMESDKTVTTTATGCTFGTFFGAGYGGNSYNRLAPTNKTTAVNYNTGDHTWNKWLQDGDGDASFSGFNHEYNADYSGVPANFSYEFIPMSGGMGNNVARIMINHVGFSLATTHGVTSSLTNCVVEENFYGGGSLGKVDGNATSTLTNCTVEGNAYGAGFSAELPTVWVWNTGGFATMPNYLAQAGVYQDGVFPDSVEYRWEHRDVVNSTATAIKTDAEHDEYILYTEEDLTTLGTVTGTATITISSGRVKGSVYGGGAMSSVGDIHYATAGEAEDYNDEYEGAEMAEGDVYSIAALSGVTNVYITDGAIIGPDVLDPTDPDAHGNVFGGGQGRAGADYANSAYVNNANVNVSSGTVKGSVFGGGENGHVFNNTSVVVSGGTIGVRIPYAVRSYNPESSTPTTARVYAGNVYGGGRGVDHTTNNKLSLTAGRVYGNTAVTISGLAHIYHAVYGGGSLATVGTFTRAADPSLFDGYSHTFIRGGDASVTVSGGTIGPLWSDLNTAYDGTSFVDVNGDPVDNVARDSLIRNYLCLGENEGMVYGSGRGVNYNGADDAEPGLYMEMAFTNNTTVTINAGANIMGSVFGGGENGHVKSNTQVNITGGIIGGMPLHHKKFYLPGHTTGHGEIYNPDEPDEDDELTFDGTGMARHNVFRGNVYGGGRGVDHTSGDPSTGASLFSAAAGRVYGNTEVNVTGGIIYHNVYGGGSIASVGTYNYPSNGSGGYVFSGNPISIRNGGVTTVTIKGGQIGMLGENEGGVYGGGRGIAASNTAQATHLAFVNATNVYIQTDESASPKTHADVRGSVFGGGMNGHVLNDTYVEVSGGVIGGKTAYAYGDNDIINFPASSRPGYPAAPGPTNYHYTIHDSNYYSGIHASDTNTTIEGVGLSTVFLGNVYGGGRGVDTYDQNGAHLSNTAGRVYGNTEVKITGGMIFHSVFGGGSIASVGYYDTVTTEEAAADAALPNRYRLVAKQPKNCISGGNALVTIIGGQIGTNGRNNGRVFGSSRGMAGTAYRGLGYVNRAHVIIGENGGNTSTPLVKGSVFGSGENGHVLDSTLVEIKSGHIGNGKRNDADAWTNHYIGNVYGGGRGVDRSDPSNYASVSPFAGRVYRSANVKISGGQIDHNVYGGGSMASVGRFRRNSNNEITYTDADSGYSRVTICGGIIGIDGNENGHIFGASRGTAARGTEIRANLAYVAGTRIHIYDSIVDDVVICSPAIKGSVFGGGESGHVQRDSRVTVSGGTIGLPYSTALSAIAAIEADAGLTTEQKTEKKTAVSTQYELMGNVYGGGRGIDTAVVDGNAGFSMSAGYVRGRTHVVIDGTATIHRNVYGGGSMGLVGDYGPYGRLDFWQGIPSDLARGTAAENYLDATNGVATVVIKGPVGTEADIANHYGGNVYGSARGQANTSSHPAYLNTFYSDGGFADLAYSTATHVVVETGADVYGNVYGGGENGHVDFGGTVVDVLNGKVRGSVFGGGKGTNTSPTAGIVDGPTTVNIGSLTQTSEIDANGSHNTVEIGENIFGGNDAYSSPLGVMTVNVYHTKHNATNNYPTIPELTAQSSHDDSVAYNAAVTAALEATDATVGKYALKGVYGGGNQANVLTGTASTDYSGTIYSDKYITQRLTQTDANIELYSIPSSYQPWPAKYGEGVSVSRKSVVHVYGCNNTIMYVYGGGRAANTIENEVTIDGGRIYQVYAGGNGSSLEVPSNPGANVGYATTVLSNSNNGNAAVVINGGIINQVFGGSNSLGEVRGTATVTFDDTPGCLQATSDIFGGGNAAPGNGDIVVTIPCGATGLGNVYGCGNAADFTGNVTLNILGGSMRSAYGGAKAANIKGNVTVNVFGGTIHELFGGNNAGGYIFGDDLTEGNITVNIDLNNNYCPDTKKIDFVYGGGNKASYLPDGLTVTETDGTYTINPTSATTNVNRISPLVNIIGGTVDSAVFGGAKGAADGSTVIKANPKVVIGADRRQEFSGAAVVPLAPAVPNLPVTIGVGKNILKGDLMGDVFGGGNAAEVDGNTQVVVQGARTLIYNNVYGGGNAALVRGNTDIKIGPEIRISAPIITYDEMNHEVSFASHGDFDGDDTHIYYTLDGSTPDPATVGGDNPTQEYTGAAISVNIATQTLRAIRYNSALSLTSAVVSYPAE